MSDDRNTPPAQKPDETPPILPDIEEAGKAAENVEEKGEPFDSNFA